MWLSYNNLFPATQQRLGFLNMDPVKQRRRTRWQQYIWSSSLPSPSPHTHTELNKYLVAPFLHSMEDCLCGIHCTCTNVPFSHSSFVLIQFSLFVFVYGFPHWFGLARRLSLSEATHCTVLTHWYTSNRHLLLRAAIAFSEWYREQRKYHDYRGTLQLNLMFS